MLTLKVPDYTAASRQAEQAAGSAGGMLLDARAEVREGGRRIGWMRLRIPADRPPRVVAEMRRLGIPFAEKLTTEDDISEYASLAKRADRLKEHEPRLAGVLASDRRLRGSDILFVQERLFRASVDESLLTQQRVDLARKAGVSSLTVFFFEPTSTSTLGRAHLNLDTQFGYARRRAFDLLTRFFRRVVTSSAYAVVFAPFWLPVLLLLTVLGYTLRRRARAAFLLLKGNVARWVRARVFAKPDSDQCAPATKENLTVTGNPGVHTL